MQLKPKDDTDYSSHMSCIVTKSPESMHKRRCGRRHKNGLRKSTDRSFVEIKRVSREYLSICTPIRTDKSYRADTTKPDYGCEDDAPDEVIGVDDWSQELFTVTANQCIDTVTKPVAEQAELPHQTPLGERNFLGNSSRMDGQTDTIADNCGFQPRISPPTLPPLPLPLPLAPLSSSPLISCKSTTHLPPPLPSLPQTLLRQECEMLGQRTTPSVPLSPSYPSSPLNLPATHLEPILSPLSQKHYYFYHGESESPLALASCNSGDEGCADGREESMTYLSLISISGH